jgi:hypothetical protein
MDPTEQMSPSSHENGKRSGFETLCSSVFISRNVVFFSLQFPKLSVLQFSVSETLCSSVFRFRNVVLVSFSSRNVLFFSLQIPKRCVLQSSVPETLFFSFQFPKRCVLQSSVTETLCSSVFSSRNVVLQFSISETLCSVSETLCSFRNVVFFSFENTRRRTKCKHTVTLVARLSLVGVSYWLDDRGSISGGVGRSSFPQ